MANDNVCQHLQGGQGQVDGPQVPLLGRRNEIKSPMGDEACLNTGAQNEAELNRLPSGKLDN